MGERLQCACRIVKKLFASDVAFQGPHLAGARLSSASERPRLRTSAFRGQNEFVCAITPFGSLSSSAGGATRAGAET